MKQGHRFLIGALVVVALAAALVLLAAGGQGAIAQGSIIFVDADAVGNNDGTSWDNAYTALQPALLTADTGYEIWVAEGTYKPTQEFSPGDPRSATFQMKNGVAIYGGFAGTEDDLEDRDWEANPVILSGDLNGDDEPDFVNDTENSYHVFYHPAGMGLNGSAILDGFTITGGNADLWEDSLSNGGGMFNDSSSPALANCTFAGNRANRGGGIHNYHSSPVLTGCTFAGNWAPEGGGMHNLESSPTLTACTFSDNWSSYSGSGMYNLESSPTLTACTFSENEAFAGGGMANYQSSSPVLTNCIFLDNSAAYGGGVYNYESSPVVTNCTFSGNSADSSGGGMYNHGSFSMLTNCTFEGNSASSDGGGMYNYNSSPALTDCSFADNSADRNGGGMYAYHSSPVLTNCTFSGNWAVDGGGMYHDSSSPILSNCTFLDNSASWGGGMSNNYNSSPSLTDCTFMGNSAYYDGGGLSNYSSSSPSLTNCTFLGNSAGEEGGGMHNYSSSSPTLTNCTFLGNSAYYGGGMYNSGSSPTLTNCVLWGDTSEIYNHSSSPVVTYSDVQGGYSGTGNIDADPLLVDPANGDLHLGPDSPCIDAGNNMAQNLPHYDFEGDPRKLDGNDDGAALVDMGVDEFIYSAPILVGIDIKPRSRNNIINLGSRSALPVAILATVEFDSSNVDPDTVQFAEAAPMRWSMEDVDQDGDLDLLLYFEIQELELDESSTEATLTGRTFNGFPVQGMDLVKVKE